MPDESVVSLCQRRKAFRRKLRRLAGLAAYLAPAPADEGQAPGVVLPFRTRPDPLLGRFSRFEQLAAAARGEDASAETPERPDRPEGRWHAAASTPTGGAIARLTMRWTRLEDAAARSTYIRPVLTVVPGGRAGHGPDARTQTASR
jgi:hypothetical protein